MIDRIITIVRDKCDWPWRYPPLPVIEAETEFAERWFGDVDRADVQVGVEEEFGIEIPCSEAEKWTCPADIVVSVEKRRIAA